MVKFSKLGAAALALALTVTFVAPTQVKAWSAESSVDVDYSTDDKGVITYKNNANGKTWTSDDEDYLKEYEGKQVEYKEDTIDIETKAYTEFTIGTKPGEADIDKIKAKSGKGNISFKVVSKSSILRDAKFKDICSKDDKGNYYYYYQGKKINVPEADLEKSAGYVSVTLRVYGKKVGKTVLEYKTKDKDGKVVGKNKLTVNVKDDAAAITKITYGGKVLISSTLTEINTNSYDGVYGDGEFGDEPRYSGTYVTKKSGKFKATAGKGYKIVAVYARVYNDYELSEDGEQYNHKKTNNGFAKGTRTYGIEGNDNSPYTWTKIKNGGKLTLSKVPTEKTPAHTDEYVSSTGYTSNFATTTVKVVYQHKKSKKFGVYNVPITLRLKK